MCVHAVYVHMYYTHTRMNTYICLYHVCIYIHTHIKTHTFTTTGVPAETCYTRKDAQDVCARTAGCGGVGKELQPDTKCNCKGDVQWNLAAGSTPMSGPKDTEVRSNCSAVCVQVGGSVYVQIEGFFMWNLAAGSTVMNEPKDTEVRSKCRAVFTRNLRLVGLKI